MMNSRERRILREALETKAKASSHEKCPDGQHWNQRKKNCMPIPADLQTRASSAEAASAKAQSSSDKASSEQSFHTHHRAGMDHIGAELAHEKLGDDLIRAGFKDLGTEHRERARKHRTNSAIHSSAAKRLA